MLKNRYQEILVGLNLMSLVRGIISLKRNRSTLLINDDRFLAESYPSHFLSELEILSLVRLGDKFDIPELSDLRQFLVPADLQFFTGAKRLQLGMKPMDNLRELLRKFPELLDESDLDLVYSMSPESFEVFFMEELFRYEAQSYEASVRPKGYRFDLQGPKWFKNVYAKFAELINQEYSVSKDLKYSSLLHLLGLSAEEKLKTKMFPEEIPFYFFRLLSPIYRLQDFFLTTQLKRRLQLLGGDYKESSVQFWQLHEHKFENLLLASFEGVISGDRVLFFSHLPEEVPFDVASPYAIYRKSQMGPTKRLADPFPPTSLTFMADPELLGSERPYRVMASGSDLAFYHWPYPELPGSKASFYHKSLLDAFEKDAQALPFDKGTVEPSRSTSVTLDLRSLKRDRKTESPMLVRLPLQIVEQDKVIQGFEYWGPFRYRSFGLLALSYGLEGI